MKKAAVRHNSTTSVISVVKILSPTVMIYPVMMKFINIYQLDFIDPWKLLFGQLR